MTPRISVVMPTYNAAKHLHAAIESIQSQAFSRWELLCVDDGSTDETREIVRSFSGNDDRIKLISLPHRGIVPTLNHGVCIARGEFIARMDADDISLPQRFQKQISHLAKHSELAMVGGAYEVIDEHNNGQRTVRPPCDPAKVLGKLRKSNCLCHPSMLMRREAISKLQGPYRAAFLLAEDYDLWLRAVEKFNIGNVGDVVLRYRINVGRTTAKRIITDTFSCIAARHSARQRLAGIGDPANRWETITRGQLVESGVPQQAIDFQLRRALLAHARIANKSGESETAQELVNAASEYAPSIFSPFQQLDYQWRRFRARAA